MLWMPISVLGCWLYSWKSSFSRPKRYAIQRHNPSLLSKSSSWETRSSFRRRRVSEQQGTSRNQKKAGESSCSTRSNRSQHTMVEHRLRKTL